MDVNKSIKQLERHLARSPGDLKTWLTLVESHLRAGAVRPALAAVERALSAAGEHPGLVQLRDTLKRSLETAPAPWATELEALTAQVDAGDFDGALGGLQRFTQTWPDQTQGWSLLAESRHRLGDIKGAVTAAERAVAIEPYSAFLLANLAAMQTAAGALEQAEQSLRRALQIDPSCAPAHANLGRVLRERQAFEAAEASYRRALALQPKRAEVHYNLGRVLEELDQPKDAEAAYRQALALEPRLTAAAMNLGNLLCADDRLEEARELFEQAIAITPDFAQAHYNLANVLRALKQPDAAMAAYQHALELDPEFVDAWHNLGQAQAASGQLEAAEASHRRALELAQDRVDLLEALGILLGALDQFDQATALFEQALVLDPDKVDLLLNLAKALVGKVEYQRAEEVYRRAIELEPERWNTLVAYAVLLGNQKRYDEALALIEKALVLDSEAAPAHRVRARILMESGDLDASESSYRKAVSLAPASDGLRSDMLLAMAFTGHWRAEQLREAAEQWELAALTDDERAAAQSRVFKRAPRAGRRLRIGLLSAELGQHAVGYFLRPWLRALNRSRFELFMYPARNREDAKVQLFKELADHWVPLAGLSDHQAAERIRADQIDILIDTTGHDSDRRLGVIAHRAAPVQCHYIGYFATTGLSQMDYFIADAVLVPPEHDHHFTEQVWRLPRTRYVYEPLEDAPEPHWWPDPDGQIWVGSFNNLIKVREASLALWAKVLHALPEARLALKDNKGANRTTQQRILRSLQDLGISGGRVAFMNQVPSWQEHMAYYNRLDLALDSVPFNSATTGFDALWMGCPLVTLAGDQLAGRQAASLLTGLGRQEWIATSEDDYVRLAVELARDRVQRQHIRETQRDRMRDSELCDGPGLAEALSDAFEEMYRRWSRASRSD